MRDWAERCKNDWERIERKVYNLIKELETNRDLLGRVGKGPFRGCTKSAIRNKSVIAYVRRHA